MDDAGQLIYEMSEMELQAISAMARSMIALHWFSPWFMRRAMNRVKESQAREYPGNFVMHYVEGDGKIFDYGVDYVECANCKFLSAQCAIELAP